MRLALQKTEAIYFPSMTLLVGLSTLLTIFIGGKMAIDDPSKVGIIVEFVIYINMLTWPVTAIGSVASIIQRAAASQKRLNEFLQTEPFVKSPKTHEPATPLSGDIIFDNVSFTYPHTGIKALSNFTLSVKEGEKVLILGKTGSGKTTLTQLLLRFYDPDAGSITIGGKDLRNIPLHHLRNNMSYVPQDVFLFSETVSRNIAFWTCKRTI